MNGLFPVFGTKCPQCKQSCTGVYRFGAPGCTRCRWLGNARTQPKASDAPFTPREAVLSNAANPTAVFV